MPSATSGRTIVLARHGEATWTGHRFAGGTDIPLTDKGRAGTAALAASIAASRLLDNRRTVVVCSPLIRAFETARMIAAAIDRPLRVDPRWREVGFGMLEGLDYDAARERWPALVDRLAAGEIAIDWPGGESWALLQERTAAAWADAVALDAPLVIISHGVAIRAALAASGVAPAPSSGQIAAVRPAGALVLREADGGWWLDGVGIPEVTS
jgi:broad specificity phosphatase PhoE